MTASSYFISTDRALLDVEFIVRTLQKTYWADKRPRETVIAALANSLCFGAYEAVTKDQVGFARVVTDGATISWLCDVVVAEDVRGRGIGKQLVASVLAHPEVARTRMYLATKDAHGLYEQYGFERWEGMRRRAPA